jgi:hypothetical protein
LILCEVDDGQFENVVGIAINSDDKVYTSNSNGDPNHGSHHRIQLVYGVLKVRIMDSLNIQEELRLIQLIVFMLLI